MQILLIEPPVFVDAMLPIVFLEGEVVVEDVLAVYHISLLPVRLVIASLD
jgi:hypothetical protein